MPKKKVPFYKRHWGTTEARNRTRILNHLRFERPRFWWKERKIWQKIVLMVMALVLLWVGSMYGIAQWYIIRHKGDSMTYGATFIPEYSAYFGISPQDTLQAMISELNLRHFRFVSYWEDIQPTGPDHYDFSQLDWQFKMAEESGSKVSLAIGLRQPRWPECHMPTWAEKMPTEEWEYNLNNFITAVMQRYKNSPALDSYQLENEFFLKAFGLCTNFDRKRLENEAALVRRIDPFHKLIITRSNNILGFPVGLPKPDESGVSIYKRVWEEKVTHRYAEYPYPAWFYGFLAGGTELLTGMNLMVHELQAEPWVPHGTELRNSSIEEQNKSMNAERLKDRFQYARATGMHEIYFWGVEWWYWRKVHFNDPSLWDAAKAEIRAYQNNPAYIPN
jgi:hypothetical protein